MSRRSRRTRASSSIGWIAAGRSHRRCAAAIAIDQTNPVRTSRSTVGTIDRADDYLKLLMRAPRRCSAAAAATVQRDSAGSVYETLAQRCAELGDPRLVFTFPVKVPKNFKEAEVARASRGARVIRRLHGERVVGDEKVLDVIQDRLRLARPSASV